MSTNFEAGKNRTLSPNSSGVWFQISGMSSKMKGIYKSFKHISQIFVKDREMEIGYPTDVKHVGHIGCDSSSGNAPCWMNEFKSANDHFAATSSGDISDGRDSSSTAVTAFSTWSSQDFDQNLVGYQPSSELYRDFPQTEPPMVPKNSKRKKSRSTSSQSSEKSSQAAKSLSTFNITQNL